MDGSHGTRVFARSLLRHDRRPSFTPPPPLPSPCHSDLPLPAVGRAGSHCISSCLALSRVRGGSKIVWPSRARGTAGRRCFSSCNATCFLFLSSLPVDRLCFSWIQLLLGSDMRRDGQPPSTNCYALPLSVRPLRFRPSPGYRCSAPCPMPFLSVSTFIPFSFRFRSNSQHSSAGRRCDATRS